MKHGDDNLGFTLVEMMVVILIIGLAAAAVTMNYRGPLRDLGLRDFAGQVASFDRLTRVQARELDRPLRLIVDIGANAILRTDADGVTERGLRLDPAGGYRLEKVRVGQTETSFGRVVVPCGRTGATPSYALCLLGPGDIRKWLVVCGLTGLVEELDDDKDLAGIFAPPGAGGPDAH